MKQLRKKETAKTKKIQKDYKRPPTYYNLYSDSPEGSQDDEEVLIDDTSSTHLVSWCMMLFFIWN